jgi:hypothetical protein
LEGVLLASVVVYLVTYAMFGVGTPSEILRNTMNFNELPTFIKFSNTFYQPSYRGILDALHSNFPFYHFMGSTPVEVMEILFPLAILVGQLGVAVCFLGAMWKPRLLPTYRLTAMCVTVVITQSLVGGYTEILLFFLVLMEPWRGVTRVVAIVMVYLLSISADFRIATFAKGIELSYLSNRVIGWDVGLNVGEFARPAMVLLIEYALVACSLGELFTAARGSTRPSPAVSAASGLGDPLPS